MKQAELINSLKHVSAYYDMHFPSISENCFIPMHLHNLAAIMWVREYPDDVYSQRIREQLNCLWTKGMLLFEDNTPKIQLKNGVSIYENNTPDLRIRKQS